MLLMRRPVLALLALLATIGLFPAVTATAGGAYCELDSNCGLSAGSVDILRLQSTSLTGDCVNNKCTCSPGWGCDRCSTQLDVSGSTSQPTTLKPGTVDLCDIPLGFGVCDNDRQCGQGHCVGGHCVCQRGYTCPYCTARIQEDIIAGGTCSMFVVGQGVCSAKTDCNNGDCINGRCVCQPGAACSHCDTTTEQLVLGQKTCTCDQTPCNPEGGACSNGVCTCFEGYSGIFCDVNVCKDKDCGNGECDITTGNCVCLPGFSGPDCRTGGGLCLTDTDCLRGAGRGTCNNATRACECENGFTCEDCRGLGSTCSNSNGGGVCRSHSDCGSHATGPGGLCLKNDDAVAGYCACYNGFACPNCDRKGTTCATATGGGQCTDSLDCGYHIDELGGDCINNQCTCKDGFTCSHCSGSGTLCSNAGGGAPCQTDHDCGTFSYFDLPDEPTTVVGINDGSPSSSASPSPAPKLVEVKGGKCLAGRCSCRYGYTCGNCAAEGFECKTAAGGGTCRSDSDCGPDTTVEGGRCVGIEKEGGTGFCICNRDYGCSNCQMHVAWLAAGASCEGQLAAADAFQEVRIDRTRIPKPPPTDYTNLYIGLAIGGGVLFLVVCCVGLMDMCRWRVLKKQTKTLLKQEAGKGGRAGHSRRHKDKRAAQAGKNKQKWFLGNSRDADSPATTRTSGGGGSGLTPLRQTNLVSVMPSPAQGANNMELDSPVLPPQGYHDRREPSGRRSNPASPGAAVRAIVQSADDY